MFIAIMMTINSKFLCTDLVSQVGYTEIERDTEKENETKRENTEMSHGQTPYKETQK